MDYPWLYAVEVGQWYLSDEEAARLREYLFRGGFLLGTLHLLLEGVPPFTFSIHAFQTLWTVTPQEARAISFEYEILPGRERLYFNSYRGRHTTLTVLRKTRVALETVRDEV